MTVTAKWMACASIIVPMLAFPGCVAAGDQRPVQPVAAEEMNVPPAGFTALFNGRDFTGWRLSPEARAAWLIENGVLKSPGRVMDFAADLETEKEYRDFVLLVDYRMPTVSDSGISFRGGPGGRIEQFNLNAGGGGWMGHLLSFHFLPPNIKLEDEQVPQVRDIRPETGVWHTVKLTVIGRKVTAEYDGEVIIDGFEYPEGMLGMAPGAIRLQKHKRIDPLGDGKMSDCPVEFRSIFIKALGPGTVDQEAEGK